MRLLQKVYESRFPHVPKKQGVAGYRELLIRLQMAERNQGNDQFGDKMRCNLGPEMRRRFEEGLQEAAINQFSILQDEEIGLWIMMQKPAQQ